MNEDYSADQSETNDTVLLIDKNSAENSQPPEDLDIKADTVSEAEKVAVVDEYSYERNKTKMELYDWMQCFVTAIIFGIFIFVFVGRTIGVEGASMLYTLHDHDRVIMSGLFYKPKNGDVIIFNPPTDAFGSTPLVKRVIALENQTIDINFDTGEVFVDGVLIDEGDARYIAEGTFNRLNFTGPYTVPEGHIFVMGDNRNHSSDSRDSRVGAVDTRYVLGKVLFLLIPGSDKLNPRDWSRIGFVS